MKSIIGLVLLLLASVSLAQPPRPKFVIQPTALQFGTVPIGDSLDRTFTIRVDTAQHSDVNVSLSTPNTAVFRIVGSTSFTVNQGTTDTIRIRFKPTGGQLFRDTIWATHNGDTTNSKNPTRITMSGSGPDTLVHISINSQFINFPSTPVGQTSTRTVAITNTSFVQKQLTGTAAIAKTTTPYTITSGGAINLAQGATDSVKLSFTPTAAGTFTDTLVITSNAGASGSTTTKIIIFGISTAPDTLPRMAVVYPQGSFFSLNYGSVTIGKHVDQTIKLVNTSDTAVTLKLIGSSTLWKGKEYSLTSGGGSFTLARLDTQIVVIRFSPDTIGTLRDTLLVSNNSGTPLTKIPISGQGVAPSSFPKLQFTGLAGGQGNRLSFGQTDTIGVPVVRTFTIRNGNSDVFTTLIGSVGSPSKPEFVVTNGAGAYTLDSGLTKTIEVTFTATATGPMTDTLIVTSNDSTRLAFKVALNGNGVAPSSPGSDTLPTIRVNRTIFDFGNVTKGAAEQLIAFTVTNSSTNNKSLTFTLQSPSTPFRLSSEGTYTLAPGERKTDTMFFSTDIVAQYADSLVITSNTPDQTKRMVIPVQGNIIASQSVADYRKISQVTVYPNPASTSAAIRFNVGNAAEIEATLYDSKGVVLNRIAPRLYPRGENLIEIACSQFSAGMYYLQIKTEDDAKLIPITIVK